MDVDHPLMLERLKRSGVGAHRSAGRVLAVLAGTLVATLAAAQGTDIRIAQIISNSGVAEAYGKQSAIGFKMGVEYATGGAMKVGDRKIQILIKDDQSKPDFAKTMLSEAYQDDKVDIAVGASFTATTMAILPLAESYKKILLVDAAISDSVTGKNWNRYIFRVKQSSSQEAAANALVFDQKGYSVVTLGQDIAFGREGIAAIKKYLKNANIVYEEYVPVATTDFTAAGERVLEAFRKTTGKKILYINAWFGTGDPFKIADAEVLKKNDISVVSGANVLASLASYKRFPGMQGATTYYYGIPKNSVNDWLVKNHMQRYGAPPDLFQAYGFTAGVAIVTALKATGGDTSTEKLVAAMEGMSFDTPKGKMVFRKEDHQAMQAMYEYKLKVDPGVAWGIPELVREIGIDEIPTAIGTSK